MASKFASVSIALVLAAAFTLVGCGSDDEATKPGIVNEIVDSISTTVAKNLGEASLAKATPIEDKTEEPTKLLTEIADLELVGSKLYGVFDGGVIIYDFTSDSYEVMPSFEKLNAVEFHEEKVYVGGDNLYTVGDTILNRCDEEFEGAITSLYSYGYSLMVGTESGLYTTGLFGHDLLLDDVEVSAITADESGLWVGTKGEGLYRWDGEEFQKRYLLRDTTIFDTVNTLDFNHRHLYAGTNNGLHIFDGGRWTTLTALDGLPSDNVTTIDASAWVVYIGTDAGVISYFNGDFIPVKKMEESIVRDICLNGRKVIAATDYDGIVMKSGNVIKTIVPVDDGMNFDILSLIP